MALHRRRASAAAALLASLAATPVLSTAAAAATTHHLPAVAVNTVRFGPAVPVPSDTTLADLESARTWAAAQPTRGKPLPVTLVDTAPVVVPESVQVKSHAQPVQRKPSPKPASSGGTTSAASDGMRAGAVVAFALRQIGKPYRFATAGPNSFDCSGLAKAAYAEVGISIPHQTGGIIGRGHAVSRDSLQPGDLVFPSSGHVGIYIGDGLMVHAPKPGDQVEKSKIYSFWAARRLL